MKANEISDFLDRYYKNHQEATSILLDGKWGCGKTYNINKYIKSKNHENIIYLSLYGFSTLNDILVLLSKYLDSSYFLRIGGNLYLNDEGMAASNNSRVTIIFDDVERKEDTISLRIFFGFINKLKELGFNTILIGNLEYGKEKSLVQVVEKTIDQAFYIEPAIDSANDILKNYDFAIDRQDLVIANDNLRHIEKAVKLYKQIDEHCKDENKGDYLEQTNHNKHSFFHILLVAVKCNFSEDFKISKQYKGIYSYEMDCATFGNNVANALIELKLNADDLKLARAILPILQKEDYSDFYYTYWAIDKNTISGKEPFCQDPFFLSDQRKEKYKKAFFQHLQEFDFNIEMDVQVAARVFENFSNEMSDIEVDKIVNRIIETLPDDKAMTFFGNFLWRYGHIKKNYDAIIQKLQAKLFEKQCSKVKKMLQSAYVNKNYDDLLEALYSSDKLDISNKAMIIDFLKENGYFFPNLEGDLTRSSWNYCRKVALIAYGCKKSKDFIDFLNNMSNASSSQSLKNRCALLIKSD